MSVTDDTLRSLLLHRLSPQDSDDLLSRLVLEDGLAEQLELAGNDLLDDYAHGRLTPEDVAAFEHHLLTDQHWRERALAARALARVSPPRALPGKAARARSRQSWLLPAAAALAACSLAVVLIPRLFLRQGGFASAASSAHTMQTITLLAQTQRGAQNSMLHIDPHAAQVRFQLEVPGDQPATSYHIVAESPQQKSPWTAQHLVPRQSGNYRYIEITIPTSVIAPGTCRLTLAADRSDAHDSDLDTFTWNLQTTLE